MYKPLIEPGHNMLVCLSAVPSMHVHAEGVQLAQGGEALQQQHYQSSALHSLHGAAQDIGCQSLKVLQQLKYGLLLGVRASKS